MAREMDGNETCLMEPTGSLDKLSAIGMARLRPDVLRYAMSWKSQQAESQLLIAFGSEAVSEAMWLRDVSPWRQSSLEFFGEERLRAATTVFLSHCHVEVDRRLRGGVPVLKGTRFPVARLLAEIATDRLPSEVADDYDLDWTTVKGTLEGLAICFDRRFAR